MTFHLDPDADDSLLTWMGDLEVPPRELLRVFGPHHNSGDTYKISGQWLFSDDHGNVYGIRDWKSTSLWEEGYLPPLEFWRQTSPEEFTVASNDVDVAEFKEWVFAQLRGAK